MGYRLPRCEGWIVKHKRLQRVWLEEGLQRPTPRKRKRAVWISSVFSDTVYTGRVGGLPSGATSLQIMAEDARNGFAGDDL